MFYLFKLAVSFLRYPPLSPHPIAAETDSRQVCGHFSRTQRRNRSRNFCRIISSELKPMIIIAPGGATGN
jgi:hypothetical protein